jgi:hypothetical protein
MLSLLQPSSRFCPPCVTEYRRVRPEPELGNVFAMLRLRPAFPTFAASAKSLDARPQALWTKRPTILAVNATMNGHQMIAWRIRAETHSLSTTVARMRIRMTET